MIRHRTFVECDGAGCDAEILGCNDLHTNSLTKCMNALAEARRQGWRRTFDAEGNFTDLCLECWAAGVLLEQRQEETECVGFGCSYAA